LGVEAALGTTFGDGTPQRQWFLGGANTLRGYPAGSARGSSFTRARLNLARTFDDIGSVSVFGDAGWAGDRGDFDGGNILYGVGVGGSVLDGLVRFDLSHGLTGPQKQFRIDLYADALL
jgi:hemolysin activation/secretion protein